MPATLPVIDDIQIEPIWNLLLQETGNWLTAHQIARRVEGAVGHTGAVLLHLCEQDKIERDRSTTPNRFRVAPPADMSAYVRARAGEEPTVMERQGTALLRIRGLAEEAIACTEQCHCCDSMRQLRKILADLER